MAKQETDVIISPCIGICALDESDICVGCFRTGAEISEWGGMTVIEKRSVLASVKEREKSSYIG